MSETGAKEGVGGDLQGEVVEVSVNLALHSATPGVAHESLCASGHCLRATGSYG